MHSVPKPLPVVGPRKDPKALRIDDRTKEPLIGENILNHDLDEGEAHNPMNRVRILTGHDTYGNPAESQMEGGFAFSGSRYSYNPSSSSNQASHAPEPLNYAPPKTIRIVRFPKDDAEPIFTERQTIDVKADEHIDDAKLNHIADFREDWGNDKSWRIHRKAYPVFVGPEDIPEVKFHGTYVVFATYDPSYEKSTHRIFRGEGRHVRKDFFIAKTGKYRDRNKWTNYLDMPDDFLSARTDDGFCLWECCLADVRNSMIGLLRTW